MKRWWWLGLVIACHHEDKLAKGPVDDSLIACPTHSWKAPPSPTKVKFGDACNGIDPAACVAKCEAGDAVACTEAGVALGRQGANFREQLRLYTRACELGYLLGCTNLGTTVRADTPEWSPKKPNPACAADLFELTCAAGEPNGCGELGFAYVESQGRPHDLAKAVAAFKRGCVDVKLDDPIIAASAEIECGLFLDTVESGKLGVVDPAIVKAAQARTCELGHCRGT